MNALPTRPSWTSILALLLVPLLVAGGFLWGTWNANPRLRTVQAAVVNLDEMVEVNGQMMPLGRQLAAELIDSEREQNLTWVLADATHAQKGLANGTYAAVVTIPKEFSAAATSFSKGPDEAVQATIRVDTSPVTGVSETALGKHIADAASNALNRFLTGEYLKNIYLGFNQMGDQFNELKDGTAKLADGAGKLSDGAHQASDGTSQLADGLGLASDGGVQLRDGAHKLATGAGDLANGAGTLAGGTRQLAGGVRQYTDGVAKYAAGVKRYVGFVNPVVEQVRDLVAKLPDWGDLIVILDPIMKALPEWAAKIDPQVQEFVADLRAFLDKVDAYVTSGQSVARAVDAYGSKLSATTIPCPADLAATDGACEAFARGVEKAKDAAAAQWKVVDAKAAPLDADAATILAWTKRIREAAAQLSTMSKKFAAWAPAAAAKWEEFKAQLPTKTLTKADVLNLLDQFIDGGYQLMTGADELTIGGTKLAAGADQLADGASALAGGARQLAGGASLLDDGVDEYTRGISKAASGARALADGMGKLDGGAADLADGTRQLANGVAEGAGKIPKYSDGQRDNLAKVVASPIDTAGLDELVMPTVSWASLLLVMALWIGALAAYAVFRAVDPRNLLSSAANGTLLWRSLVPGLGIVASQGLLLTALSVGVLGLDAPRALGVAGIALVAAAAFVAVNHALAAWFGVKGRVASLVLLLVTVVSAIAYSAPGVFDALKPLSPLTPALEAVRMMMTGHSATLPALALAAWLLAGLGASYLAVARSRTTSLAAVV